MDIEHLRRNSKAEYERWLRETEDAPLFNSELRELENNPDELLDSFYTDLSFGTSGLRGLLGPGTNRINEYVIRRATQGLSNYLKKEYDNPVIIVAYDSRKGSRYLAYETAAVLKGNGIKVAVFDEITPVPVLSYAIRRLKCTMGIVITASHNPKRYNGYKVYNSEGYQIVGDEPARILEEISKLDFFSGINYDREGIMTVGKKVKEAYLRTIEKYSTEVDKDVLSDLKTIYTPLNGAGNKYVKSIFKRIGYKNYSIVKVQEEPDEEFTTCPTPNPEKLLAFDEGFKTLEEENGDIIVATDPDSDRVGAALVHDGMRTLLTGNQLGLLLLDYLCHVRPPKEGQIVIKSIVSTPLCEKIAENFGLRVINTLTGFKYIGEIVAELGKRDLTGLYYFGFEESNGYLAAPYICDKDGISGAMLIVEMAAFHKSMGKDLVDRLFELYEEYGICLDKERNYFFNGAEGKFEMKKMMSYFRSIVRDSIGDQKIIRKIDYMRKTNLPKSDVIEFIFHSGSRLIIRPSGTESKMKVYTFETVDFSEVEKDLKSIVGMFKTET